ncbi:MAG: hypothetical protein ACLTDF_03795 [Coprococcus sp.]
MPAKARGVVVLSAAGIVLLIISQFSDKLFYYIDDNPITEAAVICCRSL